MKKIIAVFSAVFVLAGGGIVAHNLTNSNLPVEKMTMVTSMEYPHYDSIDNLSETASDIVMGKIIDVRVEELDIIVKSDDSDEFLNPGGDINESPMLYTIFTLEISNVYKGDNTVGDLIEIKQLGGETDDFIHIPESELNLGKIYDYVFFLQSYENVPASILNPYKSAYIFNAKARSLSDELVSVSSENNLTLTYGDLESIADKN